jgi:hypothetical protein
MAGIFNSFKDKINGVMLHEYGGKPGPFNPYHTLVMPDGSVRYAYGADDPYKAPTPHAVQYNPDHIAISYGDEVGSTPTPEGMRSLQQQFELANKKAGRLTPLPTKTHGEAWDEYVRGESPLRPSNDPGGRSLLEASKWRDRIGDLSRVPASGLRPLGLLPPSGEQAPPDVGPAVASASPRPSAPTTASPPPSPRMALGGPKPMPQDENGQWVPEQEIARRRTLANQYWDDGSPSGGGWAGALASLLRGGGHGYENAQMRQAIGGNQKVSDRAYERALNAPDLLGVSQALRYGGPEEKKAALSLMLQEKDPVRALDRQIKQLELDQKKAEIAEEAMLFGGAPSPRPAAPAPAIPPPSAPPSAATPPSVPGISVAPPTPSPVVTGSVPTPAAAPAPQRPRTNEELRAVLATRSPYEVVQWRKLARKDPKEALKMLDDWTNPNKEQDKSRMKEAGEGQGKAQAALPGIVSTTDSLLRKIDDVLHEPDPKNPGKYLPDPKKPGQFIPNQTLPQVVGSFDGHPWNPTFRSSSVDMQERLKQVRGGAFLQAFESLRGAGSITEKEAEPATAALARLDNLRQSEEGYIEALNDFRKEVLRLRQLAFDRASGKLPMPSLEPPSPQAAGGPPGTAKPDPLGIR